MNFFHKLSYTLFFLFLTSCILTHSQLSLYYAFTGLELWYTKMIPALLPFMIVSGIMVRMKLTESFSTILYPLLLPIFKLGKNACYVIIMGFLCGFPMGAKVISELVSRDMLTKRESEYLLAFCNNIGPVYFCSFVLPLLGRKLLLPYLLGMYGIPLFYGLLLRYTLYRDLYASKLPLYVQNPDLQCCSRENEPNLLEAIDDSISSSISSILSLGGYMILFNLLNLLPHILLDKPFLPLAPLLEITGGLGLLKGKLPVYCLILLSFGGFSCIAQTYSCIKGTGLSICRNTLHRIVIAVLTALYYLLWFFLSPTSFLR